LTNTFFNFQIIVEQRSSEKLRISVKHNHNNINNKQKNKQWQNSNKAGRP